MRKGEQHDAPASIEAAAHYAPFICDFACRSHQLVIELDGSQHIDAVINDEALTRRIQAAGDRVIRFWNNDLTTTMPDVLETIVVAARLPIGGTV